MYLKKIELINYRPYFDKNSIEFEYNKENNVNVIYANNATGKSSLLNAITWAFYGKELHDLGEKANPIYNKLARNNCEIGGNLIVSVSLDLYDHDENGNKLNFKVKRSETYVKKKNGEMKKIKSELKVFDFDGKWYDNDQVKIDSAISKFMHKYFFFNGEQLDDYFNKKDIRKTIERISQIDLISTVNDHLVYVNSRYNTEIAKLDKDLKQITDKINASIQNKKELETKRNTYEKDIERFKDNIEDCNKKLDLLKNAKKLSDERNKLLNSNSKLNGNLSSYKDNYTKTVVELYSIINLFDVLYNIYLVNKDYTSSEITIKDLKKFYEYLLNQDVCVCGVNFNENPDHKIEIQGKLDELENVDIDDLNNDLSDHIEDIEDVLKSIKPNYEKIEILRKSIREDSRQIKENNARLLEISNSLTDSDDEDIKDTEQLRVTLNEQLTKKENKLKNVLGEIGSVKQKIEYLTKKRDKILENNKEANILKTQLKFCEKATKVISSLNDDLKDDILLKITDLINSQVSSSDFSNESLGEIKIDEKFNVSLTDSMGDIIFPGDLSGGQRRSLALAFIIALNNINGFDLPLFIDAPFSTLDDNHINQFISNIPKFTSEKQLIFLFIKDTYDKGIDEVLDPYICKKIELYREEEFKTKIL